MSDYSKVIAWAATRNVLEADKERKLYHVAAKRVPPTRKDYPNLLSDMLKVAAALLDGEIEYRRGEYDRAFESLPARGLISIQIMCRLCMGTMSV
ncbi:hypothetical protein ETB97_000638 [Aspergillus alliaceus]|uniref:Uncharacterized protein n=1 Tax=Petromyces alliaceus TaxID=209559 RepID=A0A8H6AFP0_PETAA|nr:hypothetical protein ETB97_000638 [Aspergillus burnettii]